MIKNEPATSGNGPDRNPYVFLVGCPRSGTTLLRRMLDAHPVIAVTRETHWIPRFYRERTGLTPEDRVTPELVAKLAENRRFPKFKVNRQEIETLVSTRRPISYSDFVSGFFDLVARSQGKRVAGDKTPGYVRNIPLLHDLWPQARFVHLIRDGRDICLSIVNWEKSRKKPGRMSAWGDDPVSTTALFWAWNVELGLQDGRPLGPDLYHEIRYEDLVRNPEAVCTALCEFLGLAYDDAMIRYHEGRTKTDPGLSAKKAWLPPIPGLRDWRVQMPAEDVARCEAVAGDLLEALGYERGSPQLSDRAQAHGALMRRRFDRRPLTQRWLAA